MLFLLPFVLHLSLKIELPSFSSLICFGYLLCYMTCSFPATFLLLKLPVPPFYNLDQIKDFMLVIEEGSRAPSIGPPWEWKCTWAIHPIEWNEWFINRLCNPMMMERWFFIASLTKPNLTIICLFYLSAISSLLSHKTIRVLSKILCCLLNFFWRVWSYLIAFFFKSSVNTILWLYFGRCSLVTSKLLEVLWLGKRLSKNSTFLLARVPAA